MAYLRPSRPIAPDVLLTADPATAMAIAQEVIDAPLMANHSFGLWGYAGLSRCGRPLAVHSTGIGGPSAAVVLAELAEHGARRAIRVATAAALDGTPGPGTRIVATSAVGADGTSRLLGNCSAAEPNLHLPDPQLTEQLLAALGPGAAPGRVLSTDLAGEPATALTEAGREAGAGAHDLETAAVFAAGRRAGVAVAAVLVVENGRDAAAALVRLAGECAAALSSRPADGVRARR